MRRTFMTGFSICLAIEPFQVYALLLIYTEAYKYAATIKKQKRMGIREPRTDGFSPSSQSLHPIYSRQHKAQKQHMQRHGHIDS